MSILGTALRIAAVAHESQTDKGGKPYLLHPLRMMMRLRTDDEELMAIAILHDVIEDCEIPAQGLLDVGMTQRVVDGVIALTRPKGEPYMAFIHRCAANRDALLVKLEDLKDNSDITRLKGIEEEDIKRVEKYHRAYVYLKGVKKADDLAYRRKQ